MKPDVGDPVAFAVTEERQRISRELHDRVLQLLATARLRAENCQQQFAESAAPIIGELKSIESTLDRSITEIRNLLSENQLENPLQAGSLERRLREELEIFCQRTGFKLHFQCAIGAHNLPATVERELYFTLREAVLNAVRHSRASELHLSLKQTRLQCQATLRDNGVGFNVNNNNDVSSHYGLKGMRERIRKIGGELVLDSAPGKGTEIQINVPLVH